MKQRRASAMVLVALGLLAAPAASMAQGTPPDTVPVPLSIRNRVSTSATGLTQEFAISGRMVRLQGRFQSLATASLDENGQPVVECHEAGSDVEHVDAIE